MMSKIWNDQISVIILITNISEKVLMTRFGELNEFKDKLIQSISHDIKTPLNGLLPIL
jgi:K+-sensing histidine kinase KdpD